MLQSREYKDWSEKIDNDRKAYREQLERERSLAEISMNHAQLDILNGNWEAYVPFGDIDDFFQIYANDEIMTTLFSDKEIVKKLIKKYGIEANYIRNCPEHLQADEEIGLMLVQNDGEALLFLDLLQNNDKVVFAACKQSGSAYEYASNEKKLHKEIALRALESSKEAEYVFEN